MRVRLTDCFDFECSCVIGCGGRVPLRALFNCVSFCKFSDERFASLCDIASQHPSFTLCGGVNLSRVSSHFQSCAVSLCGGNLGCSVTGLIVFLFDSGDACRDVCLPSLFDVPPMPSARLLPQRGSCLFSAFVPQTKDARFHDHS